MGIIGGGKYEKIKEQLDDKFKKFDHIFSECGCVYYKNEELIYKKNLREHVLYPNINVLIKKALWYLSNVDYTITGSFIDLRNGIVYISLIGMQATKDERSYFMDLDKKHDHRKKLLNILLEEATRMNVNDKLEILEGGSVGIGIYPKEYDKTQVIDILSNKYDRIYYFGDKYMEGGNDYNIINHQRTVGYGVDNVEDTINKIKNFLL